jgi:glycosyltransferase involved in cell wall biosynthesis
MTQERIRVLLLSGTWPHIAGSIQAADVVPYELARYLAEDGGFDVVLACTTFVEGKRSPAVEAGLAALTAKGVRMLPFIHLDQPALPAGIVAKWSKLLLSRDPAALVPGYGQADRVLRALRETLGDWLPEIAIPMWNYEATAVAAGLPCPIYAFYGNPEHKVYEANLAMQWHWERRLSPAWLARHLADRLRIRAIEKVHLAMMRRFALIAQNAANDAAYYEAQHIPGIHYLRNMWPAPADESWRDRRDALEQTNPVKIAGNLGHLSATANSFGLWAIGAEILPALRRRLGPGGFEMHIYGRLQPRPYLKAALAGPDVQFRGFIDDIDTELYSCPIFLLANNRYNFKVGHTRILHAFALGACIVAYRDTALAMPELVDGENILLADDGEGIAEQIARAAQDLALRRRLGAAGLATLRTLFDPADNVAQMADRMRTLLRPDRTQRAA